MSISNPNKANNNNYRLIFSKFESVNFFSNEFIFPGIVSGASELEHTKFDIPIQGTSLIFPEIEIPFFIDSNFSNYIEIYDWIIKNSCDFDNTSLSIIFLNDFSKILKQVNFYNVFPIKLGSINFNTNASEDLGTIVSLRYSSWEFKK